MSTDEKHIVRRELQHGKIAYKFQWNVTNHERLGKTTGDLAALWAHLNTIVEGKIPSEPFTSPFYRRASSLRLKKMSNATKIGLRNRFLRKGLISENVNDDLVKKIREYHRLRGDKSYSSDHSILTEFLNHDPQTLAIEVPVWSEQEGLSGHIDLVRFVNGTIEIADYKPGPMERTKSRFLNAVPQIAAYGEMMAHHLAATLRSAIEAPLLPKIQCSIFDTHSCWHFGAEMFVNLRAANLLDE
ncbi:MAG: PD-(D/E)XK nuclease family protein [Candidatus Thorarchaeota archaeon]|nr:PD-(D/E)XK nuclease family protein [Candidatus Thorarchaeota archaeon]